MNTEENVSSTPSKTPSHTVYQVRERKGAKGFFTRIGSAWPHRDGNGFNVQLDAIPIDGRITLRVVTEAKE